METNEPEEIPDDAQPPNLARRDVLRKLGTLFLIASSSGALRIAKGAESTTGAHACWGDDSDCASLGTPEPTPTFGPDYDCHDGMTGQVGEGRDNDCGKAASSDPNEGVSYHKDSDCGMPGLLVKNQDSDCGKFDGTIGKTHNDADCGNPVQAGEYNQDADCSLFGDDADCNRPVGDGSYHPDNDGSSSGT